MTDRELFAALRKIVSDAQPKLAYSFKSAAEALDFKDPEPLYDMYRKGQLKAAPITDNGTLRISRDELERLLQERGVK